MNRLLLVLAAALAALTQSALLNPPTPLDAAGSLDRFSAERAQAHLARIAERPHPIGSADNARVRDYLVAELTALGLAVEVQRTPVVYTYRQPRQAAFAFVENIVAVKGGSAGTGPALLLMSHYDSRLNAPGAGDDGAGTAVILETLRALQAGPPLARDLVVLITDGEEAGLYGAQAFVQSHPLAARIGLVLNFEARGSRGPVKMFETSTGNAALIGVLADTLEQPVANALFYEAYRRMPNDTDLSVMKAAGLPGLNWALVGGFFDYHSPTDTPANFSAATLQHMGEQALAATRAFGLRDLPVAADEDAAYFDLLGLTLVHFPVWVAHALVVLALALWVTLLGRARGDRRVTTVGVARGSAAWLGVLVLAAALATLAFRLTGFAGDDDARSWWGIAWLDAQVITFALLAAGVAIGSATLYCARWPRLELVLGALLLWVLAAGVVALGAPSASAVFSLPVIGALIAQHALFERAPGLRYTLGVLAGAAWGFLSGAFLVQFVHLGLGYAMPAIPVAVAVLVLGLGVPMLSDATPWRREPVGPALLGAGLAGLVALALVPPWGARHPRPVDLFLIADRDAGTSEFASSDAARDAWQLARVPAEARRESFARLVPGYDAPLWTAPTDAPVTVPGPRFSVLDSVRDGAARVLTLRFAPPAGAISGNLWFAADAMIEGLELVGTGALPVSPATTDGWRRIRWNAVPAEGVALRFRIAGDAPLRLRSVSLTPGFPAPYTDLPAGRLPDTMVRHYGYGDATLIVQSVTL